MKIIMRVNVINLEMQQKNILNCFCIYLPLCSFSNIFLFFMYFIHVLIYLVTYVLFCNMYELWCQSTNRPEADPTTIF